MSMNMFLICPNLYTCMNILRLMNQHIVIINVYTHIYYLHIFLQYIIFAYQKSRLPRHQTREGKESNQSTFSVHFLHACSSKLQGLAVCQQ